MKGRDDNKAIFYNSTPNHLDSLLTELIQNPKKKDLALAITLILKECFESVEIIDKIGNEEKLSKLIDVYLKILANDICILVDIPEKYSKKKSSMNYHTEGDDKLQTPRKSAASSNTEYNVKSGILGFEIDLMSKGYEPPENAEGIHNKTEAYQIERTLSLYLKNEMIFLISKWLKNLLRKNSNVKIKVDESFLGIFDIYMKEFFLLIHSVKNESEVVELMNTLTDLLLNFNEKEIYKIEKYLGQIFGLLGTPPGYLIQVELSSSESKQKIQHQASTKSEKEDSQYRTEKSHDFDEHSKQGSHNLHPPTHQISHRIYLEKEIKENILWIINAIFEQNYSQELIDLYSRLKVEELIKGCLEVVDIGDTKQTGSASKNKNSSHLKSSLDYDEQIRILQEKLDKFDEDIVDENEIMKLLEDDFCDDEPMDLNQNIFKLYNIKKQK